MTPESASSRRQFLKTSAIGAAGLTLTGIAVRDAAAAGWQNGVRINPAIPDERVVCCYDQGMITDLTKALQTSNFSDSTVNGVTVPGQNSYVNTARVETNMDSMAKTLSGQSTANTAWETVFMKPTAKSWSQVKVAIKVNCIYGPIMTKVAVIGKLCKELMRIGVLETNITLFGGKHGAYDSYLPYLGRGLPANLVIDRNRLPQVNVPVGPAMLTCCGVIAQQTGTTITYPIDILINIAVNKGHSNNRATYTLCMKNHTGTLKYDCPTLQEILDENRSEAIIGTMGNSAIPPRQQLCIVDSLWACADGNKDPATHMPCRLVMGTVAPVVDHLTGQKIRNDIMGAANNPTLTLGWIRDAFGIDTARLEWIEIGPGGTGLNRSSVHTTTQSRFVHLKSRTGAELVQVSIPASANEVSAEIFNARGSLVRRLGSIDYSGNSSAISWDGRAENGEAAAFGRYSLVLRASGQIIDIGSFFHFFR